MMLNSVVVVVRANADQVGLRLPTSHLAAPALLVVSGQLRKRDVTVTVRTASGAPVAGVQVTANQTRRAFAIGILRERKGH